MLEARLNYPYIPSSIYFYVFREGGREGKRERENLQISSRLQAQQGDPLQIQLTTQRSWPERKSRVGRLTSWTTQAPLYSLFRR